MNQFPSEPQFVVPVKFETSHRTLTSTFESGREQRRKVWVFPKRKASLQYAALLQSEVEVLWRFHKQQGGSYDPFWFIIPYAESHYGEYVTRGDGTTTTFELPSKNTEAYNLIWNQSFEHWTNGTSVAPDGWVVTAGTVARNTANYKDSNYSAAVTSTGGNDGFLTFSIPNYTQYQSSPLTFVCYVKCSTPNVARIYIYDGTTTWISGFHPGDGTWKLMIITCTLPGTISQLKFGLRVAPGSYTAYFDGAVAVVGTHTDTGAYAYLNKNVTVYVDGIPKSYYMDSATGDAGVNRVIMVATPPNKALITADFRGQLRLRARFAEDALSKELVRHELHNVSVELVECRI